MVTAGTAVTFFLQGSFPSGFILAVDPGEAQRQQRKRSQGSGNQKESACLHVHCPEYRTQEKEGTERDPHDPVCPVVCRYIPDLLCFDFCPAVKLHGFLSSPCIYAQHAEQQAAGNHHNQPYDHIFIHSLSYSCFSISETSVA